MIKLYAIVFSALFLSSCLYSTTTHLLNATDPGEYIRMPATDISERVLQDRHLKYYKDDKAQVYYVEKSSFRKLGDYSVRMFAVPVTVIIDAAPAILVVGAIVMGKGSGVPDFSPGQGREEKRQPNEMQNYINKIDNADLPIPGAEH